MVVGTGWRIQLIALSAAFLLPAVAAADDKVPRILNGIPAEECEWPAVATISSGLERCSGTYVGGRVFLTAAHCFPSGGYPGFQCESDADCPTEDEDGRPYAFECRGNGMCTDPDPFKSASVGWVFFGENYQGGASGTYSSPHMQKEVRVDYCRLHPSSDIAYCILAEEPNIQPVPIMMHCEADTFLTEGERLVAVGFGDSGLEPPAGVKRWSEATIDDANANNTVIGVNADDFDPGNPSFGDSGGPGLFQMPDGSWRVIGVASTAAVLYTTPWHHVEWMLEDPNISAGDIIPCTTPDGEWEPTEACGGFARTPDVASGSWYRGVTACYSDDITGLSETCGLPFDVDPVSTPAPAPAEVPVLTSDTPVPPTSSGCSVTPQRSGAGAVSSVLLCGLLLQRRRRRAFRSTGAAMALTLLLLGSTGCPDPGGEDEGGGDDGGEGGDPTFGDGANPNYLRTLSGEDLPGAGYRSLATGNIRLEADVDECCSDFVVGSPIQSDVRVMYGTTQAGLTFLSAVVPDQFLDSGSSGVQEVALADATNDGRNDVVALSNDGVILVFPGNDGGNTGPYVDSAPISTPVSGTTTLTVADFDCDGAVDVAAGTESGTIAILLGDGTGSFSPAEELQLSSVATNLASADFDADGAADILVGRTGGGITTVRGACDGTPSVGETFTLLEDAQGPTLVETVVGCPGHPNDVSLLAAADDRVFQVCGDGSGEFGGVTEPVEPQFPPEGPQDYAWISENGPVQAISAWDPTSTVYGLFSTPNDRSRFIRLIQGQGPLAVLVGPVRGLRELGGPAGFNSMGIFSSTQASETWQGVAFGVEDGVGFTR